jgi:hypothetical protein
MFWRERGAGDEIVVRFTGTLDATSAGALRQFLAEPSGKIVVDLSQAVEIDYYGLSVLAAEIARSEWCVLLRGLHLKHIRMLRYFGLDPAKYGLDEDHAPEAG